MYNYRLETIMSLSIKISLLGIARVLITTVALLFIFFGQSDDYFSLVQDEVNGLINADLDNITYGVYNLVRTENEAVQQQVNQNMNVLREMSYLKGGISLSKSKRHYHAKNQFTGKTLEFMAQSLKINGKEIPLNPDFEVPTPIVDEVTRLIGDKSTIFLRLNEDGDMLRVATNIPTSDGKRAVGTFIPHINPDGTQNPVVKKILKNEIYRGRAYVVNDWYITAYDPLKDNSGRIIGMLYVGVSQRSIEERVRNAILQTKVGETGYVYVIEGKGRNRGRYVISQKGQRDGEYIWDNQDVDGKYVIRSIVNKALALKPGELATERYRWQNIGEEAPRWKTARLAYYEPWDWVIGTSVYDDEQRKYYTILDDGRVKMTETMSIAGFLIVLIIGLFGIYFAMTISKPLREMTKTVESVINGEMDIELNVRSKDEIGVLANSFNIMAKRLKITIDGLRKSEEMYRRLIETAIEGVCLLDDRQRIQFVNARLAEMLGYDIEELLGIEFDVMIFEEDMADNALRFKNRLKGIAEQYERRLKKKDGSILWVIISATPLTNDLGENKGSVAMFTNITERKKAETELEKAKERAEESDRLKSAFLANMSHEIRTPLNAIIGFSELSNDPDITTGEREYYSQIIKSRSADLLSIINDILDISKLDAGQMKINITQASVNKMLNELYTAFEIRISQNKKHKIDFILNNEAEANGLVIETDFTRLAQILSNLLNNAIKFTEYGKIELGCRLNSNYEILFYVSDTGIGIPADKLNTIFERFSQVETNMTKLYGGTGLGLSISKGLARLLGGAICAESTENKGSVFTLTIPYKPVKLFPISTVPDPNENKMISGKTVLIVEDDIYNNLFLERLMQNANIKYYNARNGKTALDLFNNHRDIELILLDIQLPDISGLDIVKTIKELRGNVIVIAQTGFASEEDRIKCKQAGCDDFISKPIEKDKMLNLLNKYSISAQARR